MILGSLPADDHFLGFAGIKGYTPVSCPRIYLMQITLKTFSAGSSITCVLDDKCEELSHQRKDADHCPIETPDHQ